MKDEKSERSELTQAQCLERLLPLFARYYDVCRDAVAPFCAQASFHSTDEHYFLSKAATLAAYVSSERVYFATEGTLSVGRLGELAVAAWEQGLEGVFPFWGHKSSDVCLIVICCNAGADVLRAAKRINYYRSYKLSFYGWSAFSLAVFDTSTLRCVCNRRGKHLARLFSSLDKTSA